MAAPTQPVQPLEPVIAMKKLILLLPFVLVACGHNFHHPTPPEFVELEGQREYAYRAVSADGTVVAVHEIEHKPKGDLAFWSKAITNQMRTRAGYALLAEKKITTKSGLEGGQLRFGHDRGQTPHLYSITVFVTDDHIFVVEHGGTKERMMARESTLEAALAGFTAD